METIGQRIRSRRKELKLTQKDVANAIKGVSHVAISQWESDSTKPNAENLLDLAAALECSFVWLLKGENDKSDVIPAKLNAHKVPLISYVQAGQWTGVDLLKETCGGFDYILTDVNISENGFALEIVGDSMEDEFQEGDIVIIDPDVHPIAGEFVVAVNEDYEATFKKYRPLNEFDEYGRQHFELIPLNEDYHKLSTKKQGMKIVGTMVEHRIYRRKR